MGSIPTAYYYSNKQEQLRLNFLGNFTGAASIFFAARFGVHIFTTNT